MTGIPLWLAIVQIATGVLVGLFGILWIVFQIRDKREQRQEAERKRVEEAEEKERRRLYVPTADEIEKYGPSYQGPKRGIKIGGGGGVNSELSIGMALVALLVILGLLVIGITRLVRWLM
jgi:hypothetical protein